MDKSNISVGIFMDRKNEKPVEEVQKTTDKKNRGDGTIDVIEIKHLIAILLKYHKLFVCYYQD